MTATSLTAVVPANATTGLVTVTTQAGNVSNGVMFTVTPKIVSLSAPGGTAAGPVGTTVTITGTTFNPPGSTPTVTFFNGQTVSASSVTATSLTAVVPANATTGLVTVTTQAGNVSNGVMFTVSPKITGLDKNPAYIGDVLTITGTTFSATAANDTVNFTGASVHPNSATTTQLLVTVPAGASTGSLTVTTLDGTSVPVSFAVTPAPPAPSLVSVPSSNSGNSVTVTWTPAGTTATNYQWQRATSLSGPWSPTTPNVVAAPTTTFTDTVPGVGTYYYQVRSCNPSGCSAYTQSSSVTVTAVIPAPVSSIPIVTATPARDTISDKVGATVAKFRVDEGGNSTYSIPIQVAPGTAGMAPKVALSYSSRAGNGVMGQGWVIEGASQIGRCRQARENGDFMSGTTPIDGNPASVNFTPSDRFCLDGVRLLVLNNGTYGNNGTTYSPENDPSTLVTASVSTTAAGPDTFTVKRKDGTTSTYGYIASSPNARIRATLPATNAVVAVSWNLARTQDSVGNYIDYLYNSQPGTDLYTFAVGAVESTLSQINYTGHVTAPVSGTYASVVFTYNTVPSVTNVRLGYQAGIAFVQSQQLHDITVSDSTQSPSTLRYYEPTYQTSVSGSQFQQMTQILECRDSSYTVCYPATTFAWATGNYSFANDSAQTQSGPTFQNLAGYKVADVDGDGRQDVVFAVNDGNCGVNISSIYVGFIDRNATQMMLQTVGQTPTCASIDLSLPGNDKAWYLLDYNGDGRADLMIGGLPGSNWTIYPSLGRPASGGAVFGTTNLLAGLVTPISVPMHNNLTAATGVLADLNGDGLPDFIYPNDYSGAGVRMMTRQADGSFAFSDPYIVAFDYTDNNCHPTPAPPVVVDCEFNFFTSDTFHRSVIATDINGDGRADLMFIVDRVSDSGGHQVVQDQPIFNPVLGTPNQSLAPIPASITHQFFWYQFVANGVTPPSGAGAPVIHLRQYWKAQTNLVTGTPQMQVVDLNGDGLADLLYQDSTTPTTYWAMINNGDGSYQAPIAVTGISNGGLMQLVDINGDGRVDIVYPVGTTNFTSYNYVSLMPSGAGWSFTAPMAVPGAGLHATNQWMTLIGDFDGDGVADFLGMQTASGSGNFYTSRVSSGTRYQPRDVITDFTNGLGATTHVDYQPLTNKAVYQRGNQDGASTSIALNNASDYGWNSPVFDVLAPLYVVSQAKSSAPTRGAPGAVSTVAYRYAGALMQSGGRGFLGFNQTWSFDANDATAVGNQYVVTGNSYIQRYPFIGMPFTTFKMIFDGTQISRGLNGQGLAELDTCATNPETSSFSCFAKTGDPVWPNLIASGKIVQYGDQNPRCNGAGCTAIDTSVCTASQLAAKQEKSLNTFSPEQIESSTSGLFVPTASAGPLFSYAYKTTDIQGDLVSAGLGIPNLAFSKTVTSSSAFCYDGGGQAAAISYGNLLNSSTVTSDHTGTVVAQKLVANLYASEDTARWYLGRLTNSQTQFLRPGTPTTTRASDFCYDVSGNTGNCLGLATTMGNTGLLLSERVQQGVSAAQDLRTIYTLDSYGNRAAAYQCSYELSNDVCQSTTDFAQQQSGTAVHRYAKTAYDSIGRYTIGSSLPFYSASNTGNLNEQLAVGIGARDEFGNASTQTSSNGLVQRSESGALGRPFFTGDNTGRASTTTYRLCGSVTCPADAKFRAQTLTVGAPSSWAYFDLLGRPIMKLTRSFDGNSSSQQYSGVCSYTDAHNRPVYQSEPFFAPATVGGDGSPTLTSTTPCATASYSTSTAYDVLGRVVLVTNPDAGTISKEYLGLSTFTTNPRSNTWEDDKNALGEIIQTNDPLADGNSGGLVVNQSYDAAGNVLTIVRHGTHGDITTTFTYDALGRKLTHTDSDSGKTTLTYNAAGDVLTQTDAKNQVSTQSYDALGRRYSRISVGADGKILSDTWVFDTAANGLGQVASESRTATGNITFSRAVVYDGYGRTYQRGTSVGESYTETTAYDAYNRVMQQQDATGNILTNTYQPHGYLSDQTDTRVGTIYQIHTLTARGQVATDERGGSLSLQSTLTYDPQTGRLSTVCSGTATCNLQDLHYVFDTAGNLTLRTRAYQTSATTEQFTYDSLNRLQKASLIQLQGNALTTQPALTLTYDELGNVCTKTPIGSATVTYGYTGPAGCSVHGTTGSADAVANAGATSYLYDADGNQISSNSGRVFTYNALNQVVTATQGTVQTTFQYDPDGARFVRSDNDTGTTTFYIGSVEVRKTGTSRESRRYLAGVAIDYVRSSGVNETRYTFTDHLGSLDVVANISGTVIESTSFDAHGNRRDPNTWQGTAPPPSSTTHGFTGQEHVDSLNFIHMNGRIYDPTLGRMLQADPIADPGSQGLNRYSYVANNPLTLTDPSGYSWFSNILRTVAGVAIAIWAPELLGPYLGTFGSAVAAGFIAGYVSTGNLQGALTGAFSAGLFSGIGAAFDSGGFANSWATSGGDQVFGTNYNLAGFSAKVLAHGIAGGVMSSLEGGKFGSGFASAGIAESFSGAIDKIDTGNPIGQSVSAQRVVAAAILGGTASAVAGGKFANGAITGAFSRAFNDEAHAAANHKTVTITRDDGSTEVRSGSVGYSWIDNNPGNMQGGAGDYSPIGYNGAFAIFATEEDGFNAMIANLHAPAYQQLTIAGAISKWAPGSDGNDPVHYAQVISDWTGISPTTVVNTLTTEQYTSVANAIKRFEGWHPGTVTTTPAPNR